MERKTRKNQQGNTSEKDKRDQDIKKLPRKELKRTKSKGGGGIKDTLKEIKPGIDAS